MDAFGFNTPSYGAPSSGLDEILQWLKKEDVVEGDATEPAGEYYRKAQEKKLEDLFGGIDPSYLKTLGNAGGGGGGGSYALPSAGTPNIPRILDAVPLEYLIPMLGLAGIGKLGGKQG